MAIDDPVPASPDAGGLRNYLHEHWKWYAFQGALFAIVGFLALLAPVIATIATTLVFGWLFLLGGLIGLVTAFRGSKAPGFWSNLLFAILSAVFGALILWNPIAGAVTLTWILATFLILSGVLNFSWARAFRGRARYWMMIVSGVLDILLALFLLLFLPAIAPWAVGIFVGVSLVTSGIALLFAALEARNDPAAQA
jgi:uncharacterized membrane protein HdeD (DUF308 family)